MPKQVMLEALLLQAAAGDEVSQARLWLLLRQRFLGVAHSIVHDPHLAEEVLEDSFIKVLERVGSENFSWEGVAQFVRYFKSTVRHTAISSLRKLKRVPIVLTPEGDLEDGEDWTERIPDPKDPITEEEEAKARADRFRHAYREVRRALQGPSQKRLLQAYEHLAEVAGAERWSRRQKNRFLRETTGMSASQLAPTKTRVEAKCWEVLKANGLVIERNPKRKAFKERGGKKWCSR